ncbi:MAG: HAD hydrolase-like protein [Oscillospiraceae bacterium]|nr:HAD hydrolase-like protein [Oscillospiraceae bacterium]MCR5305742.1 HAD hydrolase-like protein [Oscillospiraceae bacterium]
MPTIKYVIFDLDGTLLDTSEGILESIAAAAEKMGLPPLTKRQRMSFLGPPLPQSFVTNYGCSAEEAQRAAAVFRAHYQAGAMLKAKPYRGIFALCRRLKENGIRMAVATYKREDYALTLLRHFGFDRYCDPMHGADPENRLKKEDIVRLCQKEMGADAENSVLVGDTAHDARGAVLAGTPFLAVTYGFGFRTEADAAEFPHIGTAAKPSQIADILLQ